MLKTLLTAFIGGLCAWFFTDFVTRPLRRFFDLRRHVNRRLVEYGNVRARAKLVDEMDVLVEISPAEEARLTEAQKVFRGLAGEMRAAISNSSWFYFCFEHHPICGLRLGSIAADRDRGIQSPNKMQENVG